MATIAAYSSPAIGHLFPLAGVLLELQRRGHRVRLRTLASQLEPMRALGFEADAIDERIEAIALDDWQATSAVGGLQRAVATFAARGELDGPDLRALLDEVRPDLVITDINAWGAAAVAEASALPWVALAPYTPPVRSKGWPPFGPGLRPARGPLGRIRDAAIGRLVLRAAELAAVPAINHLRASVTGLPPVASYEHALRLPPVTLVTTAEPLEYHHTDWEPDLVMVGPTAWEPPADAPAWLDGLDLPVVLVTTSSEFQGDAEIVRVALEALRDEPVAVIATMPAGAQLGMEVPPNARVVDFLPHGPVLERAVCAITHGGMGATQRALGQRVPVVVVPWGRDQLEVAARVEHAGAGVRVPRGRLTPDRLRDAVRRARGMRAGVEAVADGFEAAGGAARAASLVEARLRSPAA